MQELKFDKPLQRSFEVDRETLNEEKRTVELSIASETPVERWFGFEILDCNESSVDLRRLNNGAAVRDFHSGDQIGVVLRAWIDQAEKKIRVEVEFSKNTARANEIYNDVRDGIRRNVSIRYQVRKIILEKEENDVSTYRVNDWEIIHVSIEADPADASVGFGRSNEEKEIVLPFEIKADKNLEEQIRTINDSQNKIKISITNEGRNLSKMEPKELELQLANARSEGKTEIVRESTNVLAMARMFAPILTGVDVYAEAQKFINESESGRDNRFASFITSKQNDPKATNKPDGKIGMSDKEINRFSIRNLIASSIPKSNVKADFEIEVSNTYRGSNPNAKGDFSIPPDVLFSSRTLNIAANSEGGYLKGTEHKGGSFIELMRNKMLCFQLGAQVLDGLVGDVSIPVQLTASSLEWVAENTAASAQSDATFGQRTLSPKTGSAFTSYGRKLLLQSSPSVDMLVENDLRNIAALGLDAAIIKGAGTDEPTGIKNTVGVGSVTGTTFTRTKALEFLQKVETGNLDVASMAFLMNPVDAAKARDLKIDTGSGLFLLNDANKMIGYNTGITNQISSGEMLFGDFSQVIVGQWGGIDILVDPYSLSTKGEVKVILFVSADVALRYPAAFAYSSNVTWA